MSASANEMVVLRAIDAIWNRGDLDVADELFAADYVNHGGLVADLVDGPESIKFSAAFYRVAFPTLHVTVEEMTTHGNVVRFRWTAAARSVDDPKDESVAANQQLLTGITRSRLASGRITESWTDWDRTAMLHALGVESVQVVPINARPFGRRTPP